MKIHQLQEEWNHLGTQYTREVNQMVAFGEKHGWEHWKGEEPEDKRSHLANEVLEKLRIANQEGSVAEFRSLYPPAHAPFAKLLQQKGQSIEQLHFIKDEKIVFLIGTSYQKRQAYVLNGTLLLALDERIEAVGKSKQNEVFAIATHDSITTTQGWQGESM